MSLQANFSKDFFLNGSILCFDKPLHWTSFQLVNKVRWLMRSTYHIPKIKVGHAGTLDPLATGLVILCTGKATKTITELMGQKKVYTGQMTFGASRPSYDMETEIDHFFRYDHITKQKILEQVHHYTGKIQQKPPIFSALKKEGKRLYEYARKGESVEIALREVFIHYFIITKVELPTVDFEVCCSKGTYIRSLVHDFGQSLGSGAYLSQLQRTHIGEYTLDGAFTIDSFTHKLQTL